jgi:predicted PurR-regulated permease PerM
MQANQYPFYIKSTVTLLGLVLFAFILYTLSGVLIPFAFAVIIAILINPLINKFRKWGLSHVLAITAAMIITFTIISSIVYFLSSQIIGFSENLPVLKQKFNFLLAQLHHWVQTSFGLAITKQVQLINEALDNSKALLGKTVGTALDMLIFVFILPVYIFLLLFYKTLILNFLYEIFAEENSKKVSDILNQTKTAIQSYMVGLVLEAIIVAVLNSTALLMLGIDYAILLGVIGAILNLLPYIGGLVAIALPVLMATVTKDGFSTQLGILGAYAIIQFIDNNFLIPKIVSSKVEINALISIVIVLLGNALWGIPGMFLSIPFVAILKIILDRVDGLRPWGKLLGDTIPTRHKGEIWPRRRKKPSVAEKIVEDSQ